MVTIFNLTAFGRRSIEDLMVLLGEMPEKPGLFTDTLEKTDVTAYLFVSNHAKDSNDCNILLFIDG